MDTKSKIAIAGGAVGTAVIGILLLARGAKAKPPPPSPGMANLYGKVTDSVSGKGIPGVSVSVNGYSTMTDATGYYEILEIVPGSYAAQFSKAGYNTEVR